MRYTSRMNGVTTTASARGSAADSAPCRPPEERFPKLKPLLQYLDSLTGRADLETLSRLLRDLQIGRCDIEESCRFAGDRYQRNIIKESPWYELVALCWHSGQRTPIHDHRGSSCAFRVVHNSITEIRFEKSPSGLLISTGSHEAPPGYICASYDDDIHQVLNANPPGQDAITLHIYSPPLKQYRKYTLDSPCCEGQVCDAGFHSRGV